MRTLLSVSCVGLIGLLGACSRQSVEQLSPQNDNVVTDKVLDTRVSTIRNNFNQVPYVASKVAKLNPVIQEQGGGILSRGTKLKANSLYEIVVDSRQLHDIQIQSGDGFDVISSTINGSSKVFTIKTNSELSDQIYISLMPLLKGAKNDKISFGRIVRTSPQNFLLPN